MNDAYYEQLVTRNPTSRDRLLQALAAAGILAAAVLMFPFLGLMTVLVSIVFAWLAWRFIFPRFRIEYEYIIVNYEMQIDAVYDKSSRKKKLTFDLRKVQQMNRRGAPQGHTARFDQVCDFTSGAGMAGVYELHVPANQKLLCVLMEPDEEMLKHMRFWVGRKAV